jgi:hypothetical protein
VLEFPDLPPVEADDDDEYYPSTMPRSPLMPFDQFIEVLDQVPAEVCPTAKEMRGIIVVS